MVQLRGITDDIESGRADAVSEHDFMVGSAFAPSGSTHPVIFDPTGDEPAFDLEPDGHQSTRAGFAWGVNSHAGAEVVVGQRFRTAFYWSRATGFVDMGVFPGADEGFGSTAYDVNNQNVIVGETAMPDFFTHAFRWTFDDEWEDLGTLGGNRSYALAINERQEISGGAQNPNGSTRPYVWKQGKMIELPLIPDYRSGDARDLHDAGQLVGDNWNGPNKAPLHAFLHENGETFDLNDLIDPNSGWELTSAIGINNRGEITGIGVHNDLSRAYLLRPIDPDPRLAGPRPGRAGVVNEFLIFHGTPNQKVHLAYGLRSGRTTVPGCGGLTVEIENARPAASIETNDAGEARLRRSVPAALRGKTIRLQVVDRAACRVSNLVEFTFE